VATAATKVEVIYAPKHGPAFGVVFHVSGAVLDPNDSGIQAIVAFINSLTGAVAIKITLSAVQVNTASATSAAAYVSGDKFLAIIRDSDEIAHNFKVPGIKASLVGTDKETIDITSGAPQTFVNAMLTNARTPSGGALTKAVSGRRAMNRKPIKGTGVIIVP
jgi:hypothetical protein